MTIPISHRHYYYYREFERFWEVEVEHDKRDRTKRVGHLNTKIDYHTRNLKRMFKMPKKKANNKAKKFQWKGYVNCNIPATHEDAVMAYVKDEKTVFALMNSLLQGDYRIAFSTDDRSGGIKCALTCYDMDDENGGKCLSSFAGDWYTALAVALYKHVELLDKIWDDAQLPSEKKFG